MIISDLQILASEMSAYINCFKYADNDLCKLQCSRMELCDQGKRRRRGGGGGVLHKLFQGQVGCYIIDADASRL